MQVIREHLDLQAPRFVCRDAKKSRSVEVHLSNEVGGPCSAEQLDRLRELCESEFEALEPLYRDHNGLMFHINGVTAGLVVCPIEELDQFNSEWREWFDELEPDEFYDFQREGFAFATIASSGNYFVLHRGRVYYSDHDGGDDSVWGTSLQSFFERALSDPARFLDQAGCYTRYSDGEATDDLFPETFTHS